MAVTTIPGSRTRSVTHNLLDYQATRASFSWKAARSNMPGTLVGEKTQAVSIPAGDVAMAGDLAIPARARGIVLFAHVEIIRGATHLFEEPGALEQVSAMAVEWFRRYLK